ncbi:MULTISPECIES: hypothetical protein [unclassified Moorena]|uniref:hypothetical protein n=1 Tax=unclassified Moorena TaxID=2683338 RepID=UPI0014013913|nr:MULTISPECIES: hypothetical protein [unclassified Moorena]NEQ04107.1 hypothetical protein [Moorena sp. SIO3F7]
MSDCIKTLASCQFPAYFRAGRMPTLLLFINLTDGTPLIQLLHLDSLLPTNCLKRD